MLAWKVIICDLKFKCVVQSGLICYNYNMLELLKILMCKKSNEYT